MVGNPLVRGRGKLRKTIGKTIDKDLYLNILSIGMICNRTLWRRLIYVCSRPGLVGKGLVVVDMPFNV